MIPIESSILLLLLEKFCLNFHTLSIFPTVDIKKLAIVGKILRRLEINLHILLIHLLFY